MKNLIILGSGGHSKVVGETALENKNINEIAYLDDKFSKKNFFQNNSYNNKVIGKIDDIFTSSIRNKYELGFVAIGDNLLRKTLFEKLINLGYTCPNLINSKASVSPTALVKQGVAILANAVIQPEVQIGLGTIINTSAIVDHESLISEYTHICPGVNIAGQVKIGSNCFVGIGSSIIQNITIGNNVIIGAGSLVINDIPSNSKAYGVPAKIVT